MLKKIILSSVVLFGSNTISLCAEMCQEQACQETISYESQVSYFKAYLEYRLQYLDHIYYPLLTKAYQDKFKQALETDASRNYVSTKQNISDLLSQSRELLWLYLTKQRLSHIVTCQACLDYAYNAFFGQISSLEDITYNFINHLSFQILSQASNCTHKAISMLNVFDFREITFYMYSKTKIEINKILDLSKTDQKFGSELTNLFSGSAQNISDDFCQKYLQLTNTSSSLKEALNCSIDQASSIKKIIFYSLQIFRDLRFSLIILPNLIDIHCMLKNIKTNNLQLNPATRSQLEKQTRDTQPIILY